MLIGLWEERALETCSMRLTWEEVWDSSAQQGKACIATEWVPVGLETEFIVLWLQH